MQEERKQELLKILESTGYCTVEHLARCLYTSNSTIRRNLTELEKQGYITRSHGGAELCNRIDNTPLKLRYKRNHPQKELIAERALRYIPENAVIFLDGSSTCLHLAAHLKRRKQITVYTNSLEACSLLANLGIPTYCLGGELLANSLSFVGDYAIQMAQTLYFDALFFSCSGYADGMISDYSEAEAHLRRMLVRHSRKQYFLCDSSKFGKSFPHIICRDTDITEIISE